MEPRRRRDRSHRSAARDGQRVWRWIGAGLLATLFSATLVPMAAVGAPAYGTYLWPVVGPVIRGFDPPDSPYGSGHRGIDIAVPVGTPVRAAHEGVVAFAGRIGAGRYVSIDHPDEIRTTYSWLAEIQVRPGQHVSQGTVIGTTGEGHPGSELSHLHFGARLAQVYVDPWSLLAPLDLSAMIHLAPVLAR